MRNEDLLDSRILAFEDVFQHGDTLQLKRKVLRVVKFLGVRFRFVQQLANQLSTVAVKELVHNQGELGG